MLIPTTDIQGNEGFNPEYVLHVENGGNKISTEYSNQDYITDFGGTSAACPHVAAVAALILSINPSLTSKQVRNIIESTAQKVGNYTYTGSIVYPNGTWHEQMGYGLVNAYEAVKAASCTSISLHNFQPEPPTPYKRVICKEIDADATVPTNTKLELNSIGGSVTLSPNFAVETGAEPEINITP